MRDSDGQGHSAEPVSSDASGNASSDASGNASSDAGSDASANASDASAGELDGGTSGVPATHGNGCSCRAADDSSSGPLALAAGLLLAAGALFSCGARSLALLGRADYRQRSR